MTPYSLLREIRDFITESLLENTSLPQQPSRFHSGEDIVRSINEMLSDNTVEEEYNPYMDDEACDILERAGIATYKYRLGK